MNIAVENLPPYQQITCTPISEAAAALSAAKTDLDTAKKDHVQAEQELPAAEWRDAEAEASALEAGKPAPKTEVHTVRHVALLRALAKKVKVATLRLNTAHDALGAALDEHGDAYRAEAEGLASELENQWRDLIGKAVELHAAYSRANSIARKVGSERLVVSAIGLDVRRDVTDAVE